MVSGGKPAGSQNCLRDGWKSCQQTWWRSVDQDSLGLTEGSLVGLSPSPNQGGCGRLFGGEGRCLRWDMDVVWKTGQVFILTKTLLWDGKTHVVTERTLTPKSCPLTSDLHHGLGHIYPPPPHI